MLVKDLKQMLEGVPDDALVLQGGMDHDFVAPDVLGYTDIVYYPQDYYYTEYRGDNNMFEGGKKIKAFLLSWP